MQTNSILTQEEFDNILGRKYHDVLEELGIDSTHYTYAKAKTALVNESLVIASHMREYMSKAEVYHGLLLSNSPDIAVAEEDMKAAAQRVSEEVHNRMYRKK